VPAQIEPVGAGLQFASATPIMPPMKLRFLRVVPGVAAPVLLAIAVGCGQPDVVPVEKRTFVDTNRGYQYVVPPGWKYLRGEVRSPGGSLFSVNTLSLIGGDETFIADLPYSMLPQLEAWARYFFSVEALPSCGAPPSVASRRLK